MHEQNAQRSLNRVPGIRLCNSQLRKRGGQSGGNNSETFLLFEFFLWDLYFMLKSRGWWGRWVDHEIIETAQRPNFLFPSCDLTWASTLDWDLGLSLRYQLADIVDFRIVVYLSRNLYGFVTCHS